MKFTKKIKSLILTILVVLFANSITLACEACKQNKPKILGSITHGNGPQSNWDYFVVIIMIAITIYTLYATVKCFVKPEERKYNQVKNSILTL